MRIHKCHIEIDDIEADEIEDRLAEEIEAEIVIEEAEERFWENLRKRNYFD